MLLRFLFLFTVLTASLSQLSAADPASPDRVHRITLEEYEATLQYWARQYESFVQLEQVNKTTGGLGIHLLQVTDRDVPADNKQVVLITALHGGPERSGTTTVLHFVEWLLSDAADAVQTRRRQIVLIMPINNPDAFFNTDRFGNAAKIDPYTGGGPKHWDLKTLTYKSRDQAPEVAAVLDVVDRWQPDVHADMHGTGLQEYPLEQLGDRTRYQGSTMFEVTGSAYSNYALRPWDWRVTEAIIRAGENAGYPSDRFEADAQRCFHGPVMSPIGDRTWLGQPNFYTAQYGYAKYHTMVSAFEVGWEESGVARLKGLLNLGNQHWQQEPWSGYPVDRLQSFAGHFVMSWGETAAERRRSRVELWRKQKWFHQGMLYPQTDGRDTYFLATSADAGKRLAKNTEEFLAGVVTHPDVDGETFQQFVRRGPEVMVAVGAAREKEQPAEPLQHGIRFRLRLPYQHPTLERVLLNGRPLTRSATDGWESWRANGYTQVQVSVPPDKAAALDLYLITCEYTPDVVRRIGWTPPPAVLNQLTHQASSPPTTSTNKK